MYMKKGEREAYGDQNSYFNRINFREVKNFAFNFANKQFERFRVDLISRNWQKFAKFNIVKINPVKVFYNIL